MKKLILTILAFSPFLLNAQTTAIPDANFEQALIDMGIDSDGTINQQVLTSDISGVSSLDVSFKFITDLTGIEGFSSLVALNCSDNQLSNLNLRQNSLITHLDCDQNSLTSLDLSQNPELTYLAIIENSLSSIDLTLNNALTQLWCHGNSLTALNLSGNLLLTKLGCENNRLTLLDLSNNTELDYLYCHNNQLVELDLSQQLNLGQLRCMNNYLIRLDIKNGNNSILTDFDASSNPHLYCIEVDDATAATSGTGPYTTWVKDPASIYSEGCPEVTYIPDVFFELELINQGIDTDGVLNNRVFTSDISGVSSLDVSSKNISDLTGIEDFSSLLFLICSGNQLTSIDLSQNTILLELNCLTNQLTELNLSQNTNLIKLECGDNPLSNIDLSQNSILTYLDCTYSQLTSLDVSKNIALTRLYCGVSQLNSLDLTQNLSLEYLACPGNQLTNIDLSKNTALFDLMCGDNSLPSLDLSHNTSLTKLNCTGNLITSLDLSKNTGLTWVVCSFNQLEEITIGNNNVLANLFCSDNNIVRLDISQCPAMKGLYCDFNQLTELNLKNGHNSTLFVDATHNPFLYCIEVDKVSDAISKTGSTWFKDAIASYSEGCPDVTHIPDANFEQALIDQGIDSDGTINKQVFTSDISLITTLNVSNLAISDLTGIEGFSSLERLNCSMNQLTSLDLSQNPALTHLHCSNNLITVLDLNQNIALQELRIWNNQIGILDLTQNIALTLLYISDNPLTNLDISQNIALQELLCETNQLTALDVSNNTVLWKLVCADNQIASLDLQNNPLLSYLRCENNLLTDIDLSTNMALTGLLCDSNQLTGLDLSQNTALETLMCSFNQLTGLDLSMNPALTEFHCLDNQLYSLDLSQNTALQSLFCPSNNISILDLSQNPGLESLWCPDNPLIVLNVKNGSNSILTEFNASLNPNLYCIEVDDAVAANAGTGVYTTWVKDPIATYSEGCPGYTYVPDPFFEQALIDQGIDTEGLLNEYVLTSDISGITDLNVNGLGISDLTGIDDFISLTNLSCGSNLLASVDLNQNTNLSYLEITSNLLMNLNLAFNTGLIHLDCRSNQLLSLDLSQNTFLDYLNCNDNQLTSLDIRFNPGLTSVFAASNEISSIDLSENSLLELLSCENNQLPGLDLSKNISLNTLICFLNFLPDLDLSLNPNLVQLWCFDNELSSLNVKNGNNPILTNFDATGNPFLSCIQVDNESDALAGLGVYGLWAIDPTATYSESCSATLLFCPLTSGWTWFSINVQAPDMSLDAVLGNLNLNDGDYIKSKAESSTYYTTYGWFGDLSIINVEETYKIKLVDPGTILFEGAPVDPSITPIPIGTGWNWIGYVPEGSLPLDVALASLWPMNNDYIKSQSESATYYDGHGWFGDLSAMDPLEGYMLKSGKDEALTYPDAPLAPISKADPIQVVGSKLQVAGCKLQDKKFSPTSFEYSGQVNAEVFLNGEIVGDEGDMLITMSEGRIVGQSSAIAFPPTGLPVFNHLAYENSEENRNLEFYFFDSSDDQWYKFEENLEFEPDMIEANAYKPFRLEKASMIQNPTSDIRHLTFLEVYPNPAADYITINLDLADDRNITLQILDPLGRIVDEIQPGNLTEGSHQFTHDIRFLKQGYYFIRIKDQAEIYRRLVIAH